MISRFKKFIFIIITTFLGIGVAALLYVVIQTHRYQAPGRMVAVGDFKLHVNEAGTGSPTVIFESGFACFSLVWNRVQPTIAECTHTLSYDRAGLGWSEQSSLPRTSCNMVKELHTLLETVHAPKPYILVGHSLGGLIMQLYANTYPEDVCGLVLVDSVHQDGIDASKEFNRTFYHMLPPLESALHRFLYAHGWETVSNFLGIRLHYLFSLTKNGIQTIPDEIRKPFLSRLIFPSAIYARAQEAYHISESHRQLQVAQNRFSEKPVIVISRGNAFEEHDAPSIQPYLAKVHEVVWRPLQDDLATKSSQTQHIIATKSGHTIMWTEPQLVILAVRELIEKYRAIPSFQQDQEHP